MARLHARAQALPTGEGPDLGPSPYRSLARLAATRGDDTAVLVRDGAGWSARSWADVHHGVVRAAAGLVRLGLHPDQVVVSVLRAGHAWAELELAVRAAGAVLVRVSPSVPADEVARLLADVEVRLVVTDGGSTGPLDGLALERALELDLGGEGWRRLQELGAERLVMDPDVVSRTEAMVDPDDTVPRVLVSTPDGAVLGRHEVDPTVLVLDGPTAALPPVPTREARLPVRPPVVRGDARALPHRMRASRDSAFGPAVAGPVQ